MVGNAVALLGYAFEPLSHKFKALTPSFFHMGISKDKASRVSNPASTVGLEALLKDFGQVDFKGLISGCFSHVNTCLYQEMKPSSFKMRITLWLHSFCKQGLC